MLTADWQNPGQPLDVNNDFAVSPLDALVGVNRLNEVGPSTLGSRTADGQLPFYDPNGDGSHSPLDVLLVVNALNDRDVLLAARLDNDSAPNGSTNGDRITNDPTTTVVVALGDTVSLRAGFGNTSPDAFVDVPLPAAKQFALDQAALEAINGGPLADGAHTLRLLAQGGGGLPELLDFQFTLDRNAPSASVLVGDTVRTSIDTLDVEFDEVVAPNVFAPESFELIVDGGPQDGQVIPAESVASLGGKIARLRFASQLPDQGYRIQSISPLSDLAGNETTLAQYEFTVLDLPRVTSVSPQDGEEMISVTRETIVRFDEPIDPATVTSDALHLLANGQRVSSRIRVSSTERFATIFYNSPLPASTEVRLVVDGDLIMGRDGSALDADGDDVPGGKLHSEFRTLPLTRISGTNVFGFVRDSVSGDPLVGATIRVDAFPAANAVTDEDGRFELKDMPAPEFFVHIDGSTATHRNVDGTLVPIDDSVTYPNVGKPFHSVPGQTVQLEMGGVPFDVFLPEMTLSDVQPLSNSETTSVGFGAAGKTQLQQMFPEIDPAMFDVMQVDIAPGAALNDFGGQALQAAIIPVPPDRIPAPLPPNLNPALVISIQAPGASNFDVPAPITFPNLEGLAPGEQSLIFSFDHDAGAFKVVGTGTVSEDGMSIVSNGGVIQAPGWGFTQVGKVLRASVSAIISGLSDAKLIVDVFDGIKTIRNYVGGSTISFSKVANFSVPFLDFGFLGFDVIAKAESGYDRQEKVDLLVAYVTAASTGLGIALCPVTLGVGCVAAAATSTAGTGFLVTRSLTEGAMRVAELAPTVDADPDTESRVDAIADEMTGLAVDAEDATQLLDQMAALLGQSYDEFLRPTIEHFLPEGVTEYALQFEEDGTLLLLDRESLLPLQDSDGTDVVFPPTDIADDIDDTAFARLGEIIDQITPLRDSTAAAFETFDHISRRVPVWSRELQDLLGHSFAPIETLAGYSYSITNPDVTLRGITSFGGELSSVLAPNETFTLRIADPLQNLYGEFERVTSGTGEPPVDDIAVVLSSSEDADSDFDGISDEIEAVIGTSLSSADTDNDGVNDLAELQQGLDPLDNREFPTGVIASLDLQGEAKALVLENSPIDLRSQYAYVATGSHGLAIVDASDFDDPIVLGQLDLDGDATDVAVDTGQDLAVVASGTGGLHIVDVSDPVMPVLERTLPANATQVEVTGEVAYAAVEGELQSFDLVGRVVLMRLELSTSPIISLAREGQFLYSLHQDRTLQIVEISAMQMTARGSLQLPHGDGQIFVGNGVAFVSALNGGQGGFETIDVSDPDNPVLIAEPDVPSGTAVPRVGIVTNGSGRGLLFGRAAGQASIALYDVSDPADTSGFVTNFVMPEAPESIAIGSGIGFVASGRGGLQVINYLAFDALGQAPTVQVSTPSPDADLIELGLQIEEGVRIPIMAEVSDDVQLRNVELLIDGSVVANDVSFPFDFSVVLPSLASGATSLDVQVRATDTGGNSATSSSLVIDVVADNTAPQILGFSPSADALVPSTTEVARITFSEAVDATTIDAESIQLMRVTDGPIAVPLNGFDLRFDDQVVELSFDALSPGDYELRLDQSAVTDLAGNAVGTGIATSVFSVVHATAVWDNALGGDWRDTRNWLGGVLPGPDDDVFIGVTAGSVVRHNVTGSVVRSITLAGQLAMTGGSLSADRIDIASGTFEFRQSGGTVRNATISAGPGGHLLIPAVEFFAVNNGSFDGVSLETDLIVENGGRAFVMNELVLNGGDILLQSTGAPTRLNVGSNSTPGEINGTGNILMTGTSSASNEVNGAFTIGSDITVKGGSGSLGGVYTNRGVIEVMAGTLELGGQWSNEGTLRTSGGIMQLNGTFETPTVAGNLENQGGEFHIIGTVENAGNTFIFDDSTGDLLLKRPGGTATGRINGGKVRTEGSAQVFVEGNVTLNGVALESDVFVQPLGSLRIHHGLTLDNSTIELRDRADIEFLDDGFTGSDQLLSGVGEILFSEGTNTSSHSLNASFDGVLTIGSNITVRGTHGRIRTSGRNSDPIVLEGTIVGEGVGVLQLTDVFNRGLIVATEGTVEVQGQRWANEGTLRASGGKLTLGGTFPTPTVNGAVELVSGTIEYTGTVENTGNSFVFNNTTGDFVLQNGTVIGGSIRTEEGAGFVIGRGRSARGTLDNVTLEADLVVEPFSTAQVRNGLTLNGSAVKLESNAEMRFEGDDQTLAGTGQIAFNGRDNTASNALLRVSQSVVTMGADITLRGTNWQAFPQSNTELVHQGAILVEGTGEVDLGGLQLAGDARLTVQAGNRVIFDELTLTSTMTLELAVEGTSTTELGRVEVTAGASLAGTFNVLTPVGFDPQTSDEFEVLTFGSRSGEFDAVNGTDLDAKVLVPEYGNESVKLVTAEPLRVSLATPRASTVASEQLVQTRLDQLLGAASTVWASLGLNSEQFDAVRVRISNLSGDLLALASGNTIWIDDDAAGFGWFLDSSPGENEEYRRIGRQWIADDGEAARHIDLLTVLSHELGHFLGWEDIYTEMGGESIMADRLSIGQRRLPRAEDVDVLFAEAGPG